MKTYACILLAALISASEVSVPKTTLAASSIPVYFNGTAIQSDVPPEIINDRVMVPLRVISENFGADVSWNGTSRTVTVQQEDLVNTLAIGGDTALYVTDYGQKTIPLDAPPYIKDSRTMVPLRYLAESLNLNVSWDARARSVFISTPKPLPATPSFDFHTYRDMGRFSDGLAAVVDGSGKMGYADATGKLAIPCQFDTDANQSDYSKPDFFPDSPAPYGQYGPLPVDCQFSQYGYAYVKQNGEYFYIDKTGQRIDNTFGGKYYSAGPFVNGRAAAQLTKGGLFGYIDEQGSPVTEFKYVSASNFKDGAAKGILLVPANSLPPSDGWHAAFNEYFLNPYPATNGVAANTYVEPTYNDNLAMEDVYLDTDGSVLQTKPDDLDNSIAYFRSGVNFELYEVSGGLILQYKDDDSGVRQYRYAYVDGTPAIEFDKSQNITPAAPFTAEGFAKVGISKDGSNSTGYIDNKGVLLNNEDLAAKYPELFTNIADGYFDPRNKGFSYIEYRDGGQYLVGKPFYDEFSSGGPLQFHREFYYTTGADRRIKYGCNDAVKELFTAHIPGFDADILNSYQQMYTAYIEKQPNTNIYYLIWHENMHAAEITLGFFTLD